MYQKCPICNGTGVSNGQIPCSVCKGYKIISEVTGQPPSTQQSINTQSRTNWGEPKGDFRDNCEQFHEK
jgi:DnaJ-class molecular chaperone